MLCNYKSGYVITLKVILVGTQKAIPVNLPFKMSNILPIAFTYAAIYIAIYNIQNSIHSNPWMQVILIALVLLAIMLKEAALPPLQSFIAGPSTSFCVAKSHKTIN